MTPHQAARSRSLKIVGRRFAAPLGTARFAERFLYAIEGKDPV
jgi:hypothetical protein